MKKILCLLFLLNATSVSLLAQENSDIALQELMKNNYSCENASNKCALLFVEYFQDGKIDLIPDLIDYWESICRNNEALQRAKILYALNQNQYKDVIIRINIIDLILNYQNREQSFKDGDYREKYQKDREYFSYVPIGEDFDKYTKTLAGKNINKYPKKSIEYAWCEFYSGQTDSLFYRIQKFKYPDSKLTYGYYDHVNRIKTMIDWNWAISTGVWIPMGEMAALGVHPELGVVFGGKGGRLSCDFDLSIRFLNSSHYDAKWGDSIYNTNHFFGAYIGLDFGWDLYRGKQNNLVLLGGIGWDGFEAISSEMLNSSDYAFVSSYNFNFGVGFMHRFNGSAYMNIQLKCNIVNYTMNNVIDYKGVPITVKVLFGSISNPMKRSLLKRMEYLGK